MPTLDFILNKQHFGELATFGGHPLSGCAGLPPIQGQNKPQISNHFISTSRQCAAKTSPSGGSPRRGIGVHFQRAAGAVVWVSLPKAALPPQVGKILIALRAIPHPLNPLNPLNPLEPSEPSRRRRVKYFKKTS